eukprot:gene28654-31825_t
MPAISPSVVACACAGGVVRLFALHTLAFKANLPRPAARGQDFNASIAGPTAAGAKKADTKRDLAGPTAAGAKKAVSEGDLAGDVFPDAISVSFDESGGQLAVMYSDRSLFLWNVSNLDNITRLRSLLSHSACIWDAVLLPPCAMLNMGTKSRLPPSPGVGLDGRRREK